MIQARYDSEGNIILTEQSPPLSDHPMDPPSVVMNQTRSAGWKVIQESKISPEVISNKKSEEAKGRKSRKTPAAKKALYASILETETQYLATVESAQKEIRAASDTLQSLPKRIRGTLKKAWKIANTHVVIGKRSQKKPRSKMRMFVTDTIRFGGTFALIFSVLFVGVNYQSFFQIARAELALGSDLKTEKGLQQITEVTNALSRGSTFSLSRSSNDTSGILAYLPSVGPYENRLIIPKIGKNIPIVLPKMDALIHEQWKEFENDIQDALRYGAVHYPGSARPGQAGNFFVTAHSSYYPWDDGLYKDAFARLSELDIGDTYSVYYGGDKHTYRVIKKYEVKPTDVSVLDQPTSQRISTLMTCTPVGTTLRRLIVRAEEIDPATGEVLRVGEKTEEKNSTPLKRLEALPI